MTVSLACMQTRQMHGIDAEGTVVILDEAHNIVSHLLSPLSPQ